MTGYMIAGVIALLFSNAAVFMLVVAKVLRKELAVTYIRLSLIALGLLGLAMIMM